MLKYLVNIFLCLVLCSKMYGQVNLVPNGSFEDFNDCPTANSAIDVSETNFKYVKNWMRPTEGTPDYYNSCSKNTVGTPQNEGGYQVPRTGNAYIGLFVYYYFQTAFDNFREYIQINLSQTLVANKKYLVKFYVSAANRFSVPDIGAYLDTKRFTDFTTKKQIDLPAQVINKATFTDSTSWFEVSGIYTALGGEKWLTIGNFKTDLNSGPVYDIAVKNTAVGALCNAYVYIDDVSVTEWNGDDIKYLCNKNDSIKIEVEAEYARFKWFDNDSINRIRYFTKPIHEVIAKIFPNGNTTYDSFYIKEIPYIYSPIIGDTFLCSAQNITLNKELPFTNLLWSTGDTTSRLTFNKGGTYWLKSVQGNCVRIDTFIMVEKPVPVINIGDTFFCKNSSIILKPDNPNAYIILWDNTVKADLLSLNKGGTHSVSYSDNFCTSIKPFTVTEKSLPQFTISGKSIICEDKQEKTTLTAPSFLHNTWYPDGVATNSLTVNVSGTYWHTVTDAFGCSFTDTVKVKNACEPQFFMPTAFTPNNDNLNEYLNFTGKYIDYFHLQIFNRWGDLVFESNDFNAKWNGETGKLTAQSDVYYYIVNYASLANTEPQEMKGTITIIK